MTDSAPILSVAKFCEQVGVAPITVWRWRRKGMIHTVNIAGRQYLTRASLDDFTARAGRGEFASKHSVPAKSN